jgi:hypothetical protein
MVAVREAMEMAAATAQAAAEETATVQENEVTVVIALSAD